MALAHRDAPPAVVPRITTDTRRWAWSLQRRLSSAGCASPVLRERSVRLYREPEPRPSFKRLAEQLNVRPEALRDWARQAEVDAGERDDRSSTDMLAENRRLAAENADLRRVNEVLRAASAYFASEVGPTRRWS